MVMSCACLEPRHSPYFNHLCHVSDIAEVGTIIHVFGYDAVMGRDPNQSPPLRQATVTDFLLELQKSDCYVGHKGYNKLQLQ